MTFFNERDHKKLEIPMECWDLLSSAQSQLRDVNFQSVAFWRDHVLVGHRVNDGGSAHSPKKITPPKTNTAPENEPLQKEIPIGNHHF